MSKIENARNRINKVDDELRRLFEERMKAVEDVVAYKSEHNLPIFDAVREQEVIEKNLAKLENVNLTKHYRNFLIDVMQVSKDYQNEVINKGKVAYQGVAGAYSYLAAQHYFPHTEYVSCSTFDEVLKGVASHKVGYGVLPFENSYAGDVSNIIDLLVENDCYIVDTITLPVDHVLVVNKGVKLQDIKTITSHPQALMQCSEFLDNLDVSVVESPNTASAAQELKQSTDLSQGVLASRKTAELYGLNICADNISNDCDNSTKFVVVSDRLAQNKKTLSVVFTLDDDNKSGTLAPLLMEIANNEYNLLNLKSFPNKDKAWNYYFYVEISMCECYQNLEFILKKYSESYKIIGAY